MDIMFDLFPDYLVPVLIFVSRISDVSLGTLRIAMVSRGFKLRAALLGFFEVLIWTIVVTELLQNLDAWENYIAYAGGFAMGTYIGMTIESKLKVGTIIVRIITQDNFLVLSEALKKAGFIITSLEGEGGFGPVRIIFTILKRKRWNEVLSVIETNDPKAFYSYEDVKYSTSSGHMSSPNTSTFNRLLGTRKGL